MYSSLLCYRSSQFPVVPFFREKEYQFENKESNIVIPVLLDTRFVVETRKPFRGNTQCIAHLREFIPERRFDSPLKSKTPGVCHDRLMDKGKFSSLSQTVNEIHILHQWNIGILTHQSKKRCSHKYGLVPVGFSKDCCSPRYGF